MSQNQSLDERQEGYRQAAIANYQAAHPDVDIATATAAIDGSNRIAANLANLNAENAADEHRAIIDATVEEARLAHLQAQLSPHHYQYVPVGTICINPECNTQIHSSQYNRYCELCYNELDIGMHLADEEGWESVNSSEDGSDEGDQEAQGAFRLINQNTNVIENLPESERRRHHINSHIPEGDNATVIAQVIQELNDGTAEVIITNMTAHSAPTTPPHRHREPATDIPPLEVGEIIVTDQIPSDDSSSVSSEITLEDSLCCCCMESCDTQTTCNHSICLVCANSLRTTRVWRQNDEGRPLFYQSRHISDHIRPCPCCRANIRQLIRRPLSDAQRLGRYDELVAQNTRLDSEALLQATVINGLRSEIAQHNSNSPRPAFINPSNGAAIVAPPANITPRYSRGGGVHRGNDDMAVGVMAAGGGGGRRRRQPIVVQVAVGDEYAGRPSGLATVVNLTPTQVIGDLHFDARPRRRCVGTWANNENNHCRRYTRRVCPSCRNQHVCNHCEVCNTCEEVRRQRSLVEMNPPNPQPDTEGEPIYENGREVGRRY
jgi:hypothetical protein